MIPLLALGIPGDITTAIILGAFMIHGLRPGPLMFQDNISLIYALFIGIMMSSIFLFLVGKTFIRLISRIADIPHRILFPVVLVLCVFGAYAVNNTIFDVTVMFVMGLLDSTVKATNSSGTIPHCFILGPMLEDNFRQSLNVTRKLDNIFLSPICGFSGALPFWLYFSWYGVKWGLLIRG